MKALSLLVLAVLVAACTSSEEPPTMASLREAAPGLCAHGDARVRALVRSGHSAPDIKSLERVCSGTERALREIAADRTGWGLERLRAIELLAAYPSLETESLLVRLATSREELTSVRRTALIVLGGKQASVSADVLGQLDELAVQEPDVELRAVAAQVAERLRTPGR